MIGESSNSQQKQANKKNYVKEEYMQCPIFQNFINFLRIKATKRSLYLVKYFLSVLPNNYLSVLKFSPGIEGRWYKRLLKLLQIWEVMGLSYPSVNQCLGAVTHFLRVNDFQFNNKKINKSRWDYIAKFEYWPYTQEEINSRLSIYDPRKKVIILLGRLQEYQ